MKLFRDTLLCYFTSNQVTPENRIRFKNLLRKFCEAEDIIADENLITTLNLILSSNLIKWNSSPRIENLIQENIQKSFNEYCWWVYNTLNRKVKNTYQLVALYLLLLKNADLDNNESIDEILNELKPQYLVLKKFKIRIRHSEYFEYKYGYRYDLKIFFDRAPHNILTDNEIVDHIFKNYQIDDYDRRNAEYFLPALEYFNDCKEEMPESLRRFLGSHISIIKYLLRKEEYIEWGKELLKFYILSDDSKTSDQHVYLFEDHIEKTDIQYLELVKSILKNDGTKLNRFVSLINNEEFIKIAIKSNAKSIKYVHNNLKQNQEFIINAIEINPSVILYVEENFRNNYDLKIRAINSDLQLLNNLSIEFLEPIEQISIFQDAIQKYPWLIKQVPQNIRNNNPHLFQDALNNDEKVLIFKNQNDQVDAERIHSIVNRYPDIFYFLPDELKSDTENIKIAIRKNPFAFDCLPDNLKNNLEIINRCIEENYKSIILIQHVVEDPIELIQNNLEKTLNYIKPEIIQSKYADNIALLKKYISINPDELNKIYMEIDELKNEFISSRNKIEKELRIKDAEFN